SPSTRPRSACCTPRPASQPAANFRAMEPADHIAAVRRESAAVVTAARRGADAPVPSCPDWTVGDLVAHLGVAHRWATANVGEPGPIDAELAADGIDEGLYVFVPMARQGSTVAGTGERFHLHRTDGEGEWLVVVEGDGIRVSREHGKGDVAVRGRAADLLLWL